jgi:hypothetical protein
MELRQEWWEKGEKEKWKFLFYQPHVWILNEEYRMMNVEIEYNFDIRNSIFIIRY